jgi:hypothetical protein
VDTWQWIRKVREGINSENLHQEDKKVVREGRSTTSWKELLRGKDPGESVKALEPGS